MAKTRLARRVALFCLVLGSLRGQPAERVLTGGSYRLEWRHHYPLQTGLGPVAVSDDSGTLWLTSHAGPGKAEDLLTKIEPDGKLAGQYEPKLPLKIDEWVAYLSPAVSGHSVGLLGSLASGGQRQTFEGAFFVPIGADGLGAPKRVSDAGPQFRELIAAGPDQFIAAGDQEPLTLLKLDANGNVLWRRAFGRNLVLPNVAVGVNGNVFVVSQAGSYVLVQMLDQSGRLLRSRRISAKQGTLAADADGACSILISKGFAGRDNHVYLATLNKTLSELSEVETPLRGRGGRTYNLISTPRGHLAIGEGPEQNQQVVAEFDRTGKLMWQQAISTYYTPLLVPFNSGFYIVSGSGSGMDVEKHVY